MQLAKIPMLTETNERTDPEYSLIVMQWLSSFTRLGSTVAYGLKEFRPGIKQQSAQAKLAFDLLTSVFSTTGTMVRGFDRNWELSERNWIDNSLTWGTWLIRVRDIYQVAYWLKTGEECSESFRTAMAWCEGGLGVCILVGASFSAGYEAEAGPPAYLTSDDARRAWTAGLVFKVIQNECNGLYRVAAPVTTFADPRIKAIAKGVRVGLLAVQTGCSLVRSGLESAYDFSDLDM